jgi:peptidyl-prolyl cis-trans isomerase B (cyclophilin B)
MKKLLFMAMLLLCVLRMQAQEQRPVVTLLTDSGTIKIALYNETPLHRDNFLKLVREGFYDGVLFHRVIFGFMIQTGDSLSRHAEPGKLYGDGFYEKYKIPAEIRYPQLIHRRWSVAAAREGDEKNPQMESSMCQFYIVYGRRFNDDMLDEQQEKLDEYTKGRIQMSPETREIYKKYGGTPHLDGQYTVFGEVIDGRDVVDKIQRVDTDANARPKGDIRILKATVE